jgi:hypothetical protein
MGMATAIVINIYEEVVPCFRGEPDTVHKNEVFGFAVNVVKAPYVAFALFN